MVRFQSQALPQSPSSRLLLNRTVIRNLTVKLLRVLGVDRAIAYTLIGRGWLAIAGPVSVLLIATRMSPAQQGFFYTFGSILGLQVFFELGLSSVILQFASHERGKLKWTTRGTLEGDSVAKARLGSLLRSALVWYGIIAVLVFTVLLPAGLLFFSRDESARNVVWHIPWVWIVAVSAFGLFTSSVFALLEGCGLVANIAALRVYQSIGGQVMLWIGLLLGWGLFATPLVNTFALVVGLFWLATTKRPFLCDLITLPRDGPRIDWAREVWPFQWKIGLSWLSGYFIFQLFNPVMFIFHGAAAAGQMGMSISIVAAVSAVAIAWVGTKSAPFGSLIARGEYEVLDRQFFRCLRQSTALIVMVGAAFWVSASYLHSIDHPLSHRLLASFPLLLLIASGIVNHIVTAEAIYLRAHKQEPFLWISMTSGFLMALSSYFLGKEFGATGVMLGYFVISSVVGLGVGTWTFISKRQLWHSTRTHSVALLGGTELGQ